MWKPSLVFVFVSEGDGEGKEVFVMGDKLTYADLVVAAHVEHVRLIYGAESGKWKEVNVIDLALEPDFQMG